MRYQDSVLVTEITEHLKLNWDYTCKVSDDIPDGRGNGRYNIEFNNNQLGRFKFEAYIRYDWNCSEGVLKINDGEWISALKKTRDCKSYHKTFIKAIMDKAISLCGYPPYSKAINSEEELNFPSLVVKRILDDANMLRTEGKTYSMSTFVKFPSSSLDNCETSNSSDILIDASNGGAICFSYIQPYETDQGRIVDNYHTKYYTIGADQTISEGFKYKTLNWMISIREKWSANKSWHSYYPYIIVYSETNNITHIIVESQLFESDKRLFDFIIQLANLIDEETTSDEIKYCM